MSDDKKKTPEDQAEKPLRPPQSEQQNPQAQPTNTRSSSQWIPPTTGNPDLDPAGSQRQRIDLRDQHVNPLVPQGMLFDPRQLTDHRRPDCSVPEGARFDPFGPPDPGQVGPGRGPLPSSQFGVPDPDHLPPPGQPQPRNLGGGKGLKFPWGPPGAGGPGSGGAGGGPFL